jgi:hypothetical protein
VTGNRPRPAAVIAEGAAGSQDLARVVPTDAKLLKQGGAVLGYTVEERRKPKVSPWQMNAYTRRSDLQRLVAYCQTNELALGPDGGWAMVIANMCRVLFDHVTPSMIQQEAALLGRPPLADQAVSGAVQEIMGKAWGRYRLWSGDVAGAYLEVTIPVRAEAGLQKIEAMEEEGKVRRRRENRERMQRKRAAEAALPRKTQKTIAEELGVSVRTVQRMIRDGALKLD